ncbi:EmrB/QacA subfamily drug resistance transporter [Deinococcus aerius]|uniref:EmrB/QacA subfamily drug resistance transporter n=1 Tax=Deinococcus aerius TaxID=200253 RepID=A0A2I9DW32_9DEIO|nr:DHA2 family efflux MFS transporter permease subunit [Deinococcus aerius]GBF07167.1 EmrB/QacA subfamily drug resistance transporter [Deinococcus aerius]
MTAHDAPAFHFTEQEKRITLTGLMVVFLLSALDQTIVSTAMPRIIEQLHGLNLYAWVTTAYLLASTVMVPIYGKLSDLYGRKPILVTGIVLFLLGSALCGMAGEPWFGGLFGGGMMQLIVFRALQGLGGAALFTSAFAILGDMFPPAERAKFGGLFGAVFGLASVLGPLVGGFLTDHGSVNLFGYFIEGWRWVFYVNLPLGLLSLFMIIAKMPRLTHRAAGRVDVLGALLIVTTTIPLLLALTWGGVTYPWDSARILGLFGVSLVSLIAFILAEARNPDAILPLGLFKIPVFTFSNLAGFVIGMAFLGVVMFLPLYMQSVQGVSATNSGLSMLPLMAGLILASIVSGQLVSKTGQYKPFMIGGAAVLMLGVYLLTKIGVDTTRLDLGWRMFIVGLGLGPSQSLYNIAVQNAVPMRQMGIAVSSSQFFRQIGSTIGTAIFGTLLINNLHSELPKYLPNVPGMQAQAANINLGEMRAGGGNSDTGRQIRAALDQQYAQIEKALRGDQAAAQALTQSPQVPSELKALVANGGLRAQVHQKVVAEAASIGDILIQGESGRQALIRSAETPAALKTQLRALPAQAFATEQATIATAQRVQQAILAQEPAAVQQATTQALAQIRATLDQQATKLAAQVTSGMKQGFTAAVTSMFGTSIFIILIGFIITLFIPALPLRQARPVGPRSEEEPSPSSAD